jgi:hypothetical protein
MNLIKLLAIFILLLILFKIKKKEKKEPFEASRCSSDARNCSKTALCEASQVQINDAYTYANEKMCTNRGYDYVKSKDNNYYCVHNKKTCDRDSLDREKDTYLEWNIPINKCILGMSEFKEYCNKTCPKCTYDSGYGTCSVNEDSCKKFGADFKDGECVINAGQKFGEAALGTTMVRGLKNGFRCG